MQHLPTLVFVFCFGACVGSFINVVIYRLPAGMSVVSPPSRCPVCGARLKFFPENLPILGWIILRGRCRHCGVRISPQYMVIELLMALLFAGLYVMLMMAPSWSTWWPGWLLSGSLWWHLNDPWWVLPAFVALSFLVAALIAMTIIDARTFTIPIQIPVFVTITAFVAYPVQALLPLNPRTSGEWPIQVTCWTVSAMTFGAMLGLGLSLVLLKSGKLRYSFHDYEDYVKEGEVLADYPHARREMLVELLYLLPCIVGAGAGLAIGAMLPATPPPVVIQALGGTFAGYLMGGALIWGIRIVASLIIGREAMGLGDVHLLAAVGAVLGWFDPILVFFLAPFSGILWALLSKGLSTVLHKRWSELPYGPHLAVATLVLILLRPGIQAGWNALFPVVPWPDTKLCGHAGGPGATGGPGPGTPRQSAAPRVPSQPGPGETVREPQTGDG